MVERDSNIVQIHRRFFWASAVLPRLGAKKAFLPKIREAYAVWGG